MHNKTVRCPICGLLFSYQRGDTTGQLLAHLSNVHSQVALAAYCLGGHDDEQDALPPYDKYNQTVFNEQTMTSTKRLSLSSEPMTTAPNNQSVFDESAMTSTRRQSSSSEPMTSTRRQSLSAEPMTTTQNNESVFDEPAMTSMRRQSLNAEPMTTTTMPNNQSAFDESAMTSSRRQSLSSEPMTTTTTPNNQSAFDESAITSTKRNSSSVEPMTTMPSTTQNVIDEPSAEPTLTMPKTESVIDEPTTTSTRRQSLNGEPMRTKPMRKPNGQSVMNEPAKFSEKSIVLGTERNTHCSCSNKGTSAGDANKKKSASSVGGDVGKKPKKRRRGQQRMFRTSIAMWWDGPERIKCNACGCSEPPIVKRQGQKITRSSMGALCILGCWPICFLPCMVNKSETVNLYCPYCDHYLGTLDREGGNKIIRPPTPADTLNSLLNDIE